MDDLLPEIKLYYTWKRILENTARVKELIDNSRLHKQDRKCTYKKLMNLNNKENKVTKAALIENNVQVMP